MRRTLTIAALVLALACPAYAGEIHTPVAAPTPTPTATEPAASCESETGADGLTEMMLSVLESLLALL